MSTAEPAAPLPTTPATASAPASTPAPTTATNSGEAPKVVFKKRGRLATSRRKKRRTVEKEDSGSEEEVPVFKKARLVTRGLSVADTKATRKKEEGLAQVHWQSSGAAMTDVKKGMTVEIKDSNTARRAVTTEGGTEIDEATGKKIYKGALQEIGLVHNRKAGPLKNVENLRVNSRFDFAPDICKDYKETGYCGYGDSCKFMHDRGDYKTGWQIEKEWEAEQKKKREAAERGETLVDKGENEFFIDSDEEDDLPFACSICREHFVNPVMTKCKHYFCEDCAITEFKKDHRCYICKEPTGGQFNVAHDILKKAAE